MNTEASSLLNRLLDKERARTPQHDLVNELTRRLLDAEDLNRQLVRDIVRLRATNDSLRDDVHRLETHADVVRQVWSDALDRQLAWNRSLVAGIRKLGGSPFRP